MYVCNTCHDCHMSLFRLCCICMVFTHQEMLQCMLNTWGILHITTGEQNNCEYSETHIQDIYTTCLHDLHTQGDRDNATEGGQGPPLQGDQLHIPCRSDSCQHSHSVPPLSALPAGLIQISRPACSHWHWAHREGSHAVRQGV